MNTESVVEPRELNDAELDWVSGGAAVAFAGGAGPFANTNDPSFAFAAATVGAALTGSGGLLAAIAPAVVTVG